MTVHNPVDILVVDDSEDDIVMLQRAIKKANIINVIQVVNDGEQAMMYLRKEGDYSSVSTPGLVMLDINMPIKGGFEVLEDMKSDDDLKHIPVVMLTTSSREEDILKSYADGACSYISKPVKSDAFYKVIEQFSLYWAVVSKIPPANR